MRKLLSIGALTALLGCTVAPAPLLIIPASHPASVLAAGTPARAPVADLPPASEAPAAEDTAPPSPEHGGHEHHHHHESPAAPERGGRS